MINNEIRDILLEIQLNNVAKILGAKIVRQTILDHTGKTAKRIILTYEETEPF